MAESTKDAKGFLRICFEHHLQFKDKMNRSQAYIHIIRLVIRPYTSKALSQAQT